MEGAARDPLQVRAARRRAAHRRARAVPRAPAALLAPDPAARRRRVARAVCRVQPVGLRLALLGATARGRR
eukprot:4031964-Prymnesium_polylepis.1